MASNRLAKCFRHGSHARSGWFGSCVGVKLESVSFASDRGAKDKLGHQKLQYCIHHWTINEYGIRWVAIVGTECTLLLLISVNGQELETNEYLYSSWNPTRARKPFINKKHISPILLCVVNIRVSPYFVHAGGLYWFYSLMHLAPFHHVQGPRFLVPQSHFSTL